MSIAEGMTAATQWLATPPSQHLLAREQAYFDNAVADIFGYHALQLGMEELDLLRASRIPLRVHVGRGATTGLRADFRDLPIESNSVDLMVLPHTLEFSDHPHQIVREVARALRPEGQVVIAGFNELQLAFLGDKVQFYCPCCLIIHHIYFWFVPFAHKILQVFLVCCQNVL